MKVLSKNSVMEFVKKTAILWVMIILILILSVISPSFFRGHNLLNIIKQASITGVIGVGMTFVLITGGIDLSVGSVMALSGTMAASVAVAEKNMPIALVILVGVGLGAVSYTHLDVYKRQGQCGLEEFIEQIKEEVAAKKLRETVQDK